MRMHQFKTPSEANQACFVPRLLAPSKELDAAAGQHCIPTVRSFLSEGKLEVTVSAACVSDCPRYSGDRAQTFLSCFKASLRGFLLFDPVFQLWSSTDSQMLGFTWTLTLPSSSGYSASWLELQTGITSHRTGFHQPRTARQKLI